jgi:type II secretory pathway component PulJ
MTTQAEKSTEERSGGYHRRGVFTLVEVVLAIAVFAVFSAGWYATVEASIARQRNMERQFEALVVLDNVVERVAAWPDCDLAQLKELLAHEIQESGLPKDAIRQEVTTETGQAVLAIRHQRVGTLAGIRIPLQEVEK